MSQGFTSPQNISLPLAQSQGGTGASLATTNNAIFKTNSSGVSFLAAAGIQTSSSCGNFTTSSVTYVDVTNLTVTITTTGRPVMIWLQPDGTANASYVTCTAATGGSQFALFRGASQLTDTFLTGPQDTAAPSAFWYIDSQTAATYTYKIQAKSAGGATLFVQYSVLKAMEI